MPAVSDNAEAICRVLRSMLDEHGSPRTTSPGELAPAVGISSRAIGLILGRERGLIDAVCARHGIVITEYRRSHGRNGARIVFRLAD